MPEASPPVAVLSPDPVSSAESSPAFVEPLESAPPFEGALLGVFEAEPPFEVEPPSASALSPVLGEEVDPVPASVEGALVLPPAGVVTAPPAEEELPPVAPSPCDG